MALATRCPYCHTAFRVAADQLKLRGGIVRCGACQRIFDGGANLIDTEAPAAGQAEAEAAAPSAVPDDKAAPAAVPEQPEHAIDFDAVPVYTVDFGNTFGPLGILPKSDSGPEDADAVPQPAQEAPAQADTDMATVPEASALPLREAPTPHGDVLAAVVDAVTEPGAAPGRAAPGRAEPIPLPPASSFAPQGRVEPRFDLPVDEELVAQPLPGHDLDPEPTPEPTPAPESGRDAPHGAAAPAATDTAGPADILSAGLPLRASVAAETASLPASAALAPEQKSARAKALDARTRRSRMTPTNIDASKLRVPESDEPEFVKRSRKQAQSGRVRRIVMRVGAVVLMLALGLQLALAARDTLAARYPGARPALGALCAVFGCRVGLPARIDSLAIETGELTSLGPDVYALATLLRNGGALAQSWPSIELELTDGGDKPVLRRVFAPAEYLPAGVSAATGFGARSEQAVKLQFALTDLKPSGYHIAVFYP